MTSLESFYQRMPHVAEEETLNDMEELAKLVGNGEVFLDWFDVLTKNIMDVEA